MAGASFEDTVLISVQLHDQRAVGQSRRIDVTAFPVTVSVTAKWPNGMRGRRVEL